MMGGCVPDMHVWPPIRMDWRKMTKTRDSILRMNQTIVYVGFNAVEYNSYLWNNFMRRSMTFQAYRPGYGEKQVDEKHLQI